MRVCKPDYRYRATKSLLEAPEQPLERALYQYLNGEGADSDVAYALDIYANQDEQEVLQAWFVSGATDEQVTNSLRIPVKVIQAYRHLFFDMNVFRDELKLIAWVREYEGTELGAKLYQNALMLGPTYLAWMYGRGTVNLDPDDVKKNVMADSYFRGRMNRTHELTSREAQISHTYMATAIRIAESLGDKQAPDIDQLLFKLRHREMTTPVEEVAPLETILH